MIALSPGAHPVCPPLILLIKPEPAPLGGHSNEGRVYLTVAPPRGNLTSCGTIVGGERSSRVRVTGHPGLGKNQHTENTNPGGLGVLVACGTVILPPTNPPGPVIGQPRPKTETPQFRLRGRGLSEPGRALLRKTPVAFSTKVGSPQRVSEIFAPKIGAVKVVKPIVCLPMHVIVVVKRDLSGSTHVMSTHLIP